jgi:hypothetical protein
MASVVMAETSVGYDTEVTEYLYCDRCGSFNIAACINLRVGVLISIAAIVAAAYWKGISGVPSAGVYGVVCFGILIVWLDLTSAFGHGHGHICKACWNTHITTTNVLNYPECDTSIVNTPERRIHKHYHID